MDYRYVVPYLVVVCVISAVFFNKMVYAGTPDKEQNISVTPAQKYVEGELLYKIRSEGGLC